MGGNKTTTSRKPFNIKAEPQTQVTPPPASAVEDNEKVNKSADARNASAALNGETSPTKIVAWLKEKGVAWAQAEDAAAKHSGLITAALNAGKAKKNKAADMDLDTILARMAQVKDFAEQHGGKDKLLAMIANAADVEKMAEQVGGLRRSWPSSPPKV